MGMLVTGLSISTHTTKGTLVTGLSISTGTRMGMLVTGLSINTGTTITHNTHTTTTCTPTATAIGYPSAVILTARLPTHMHRMNHITTMWHHFSVNHTLHMIHIMWRRFNVTKQRIRTLPMLSNSTSTSKLSCLQHTSSHTTMKML
jgi:hypothetical protein